MSKKDYYSAFFSSFIENSEICKILDGKYKTLDEVHQVRSDLLRIAEFSAELLRYNQANECLIANKIAEKWLPHSLLEKIKKDNKENEHSNFLLESEVGQEAVKRARQAIFGENQPSSILSNLACIDAKIITYDLRTSLFLKFLECKDGEIDLVENWVLIASVPFGKTIKIQNGLDCDVNGGIKIEVIEPMIMLKDNSGSVSWTESRSRTIFSNEYNLDKIRDAIRSSFGAGNPRKILDHMQKLSMAYWKDGIWDIPYFNDNTEDSFFRYQQDKEYFSSYS